MTKALPDLPPAEIAWLERTNQLQDAPETPKPAKAKDEE